MRLLGPHIPTNPSNSGGQGPLRLFWRQLVGRRKTWVALRNLWRWAGWLWEWLENLPNLGSTFLTRREQAQTAELWVLQYPKKATLK